MYICIHCISKLTASTKNQFMCTRFSVLTVNFGTQSQYIKKMFIFLYFRSRTKVNMIDFQTYLSIIPECILSVHNVCNRLDL